ncbi:MAG: divalent-cation tolerance protein CutA [Alphaproteobacteria bacterium]|nr:divalent-cation tolerance protein CutA [Alphaproteobacteria bacterium]
MSDHHHLLCVYVTFPDQTSAENMAQTLVELKHVACATLLPAGISFYMWEGALNQTAEVVMLAKTTASQWPALLDCVARHHPYQVPCVLAWPLMHVATAYESWVRGEVGERGGRG